MMVEASELVVANLKVLGRVEAGHKVRVWRGRLHAQKDGPLLGVMRALRAETRETSLHALEVLVESAVRCGSSLEEKVVSGEGRLERTRRRTMLSQLTRSMRGACMGLESLRATYASDLSTVARLEVLELKLLSAAECLEEGDTADEKSDETNNETNNARTDVSA